jgi:hypothetical protein
MTERIRKEKRKHESAFKLARFLIKKDLSWAESGGSEDPGKISIIEVEREVEVKDEGQNILHVAIKHRRLEIYRHVKKMDIPMHMLVRRIDSDGHTLLHLVGHMQGYAGDRTQSGPAFQLQEELRWLKG